MHLKTEMCFMTLLSLIVDYCSVRLWLSLVYEYYRGNEDGISYALPVPTWQPLCAAV